MRGGADFPRRSNHRDGAAGHGGRGGSMDTGLLLALLASLVFAAFVYGAYRLECWLQDCVPEEARDHRYGEREQYLTSVKKAHSS